MGPPPLFASANRLIRFLGLITHNEIHLEAIAQRFGATIVYRPLDGSQGRVIGAGDRAIITVNALVSSQRQRFSAAHELAHWLLNRGTIARVCTEESFTKEWVDDTIERRANRFAADLLLPDFMVKPVMDDCDITFAMVDRLCEQFNISRLAAAIRLVELGSLPAMLICSEVDRRRWFIRSPLVPEHVTPYVSPREETAAFYLLHRPFEEGAVRKLASGTWFGDPSTKRQQIYEEAIRVTPRRVLSLITW